MRNAMELEIEVIEYVLGLDALGLGLGNQAANIRRDALAEVGRLLRRQRPLVARALALGEPMRPESPFQWPGENPKAAETLGEQAREYDSQIDAVWVKCMDALKALYLSSGPTDDRRPL